MSSRSRKSPADANRCAVCHGKFGLVRYYSWRTGLCSRRCRERFKAREIGILNWLRLPPPSGNTMFPVAALVPVRGRRREAGLQHLDASRWICD